MRRILVDQDGVLYDLDALWAELHNRDFPDHVLTPANNTLWDKAKLCKDANCAADIYSYFQNGDLWHTGLPIEGAKEVTKAWSKRADIELGVLTAVPVSASGIAAQGKYAFLKKHFKHIKNITIVNQHIKHWVGADILIDDAPHNLEYFEGIGILFDQPWNVTEHRFIRVKSWQELPALVDKILKLLDDGLSHATVSAIIMAEQSIGI